MAKNFNLCTPDGGKHPVQLKTMTAKEFVEFKQTDATRRKTITPPVKETETTDEPKQ